jgi:tetratricopeptide (TPR) repeat protein
MIEIYRRAIDGQKDVPWLHYNFAHLLFTIGNYREAAVQMRLYLEFIPQNFLAHWVLGDALFRQGKLEEAIAECREALRLNPSFHQAEYTLADALTQQGRPDESIEIYDKLLKEDQDQSVKIFNQIGLILTEQKKYEEAAGAFRQAIQYNESTGAGIIPDTYLNLATVLKKTGKQKEAIPFFNKAILAYRNELDKTGRNNPSLLKTIGFAYIEIGDFGQAVLYFRQVVDLEPWLVSNQINLIHALELQDNIKEAIKVCQQGIKYMSQNGKQNSMLKLQSYLDKLMTRYSINYSDKEL